VTVSVGVAASTPEEPLLPAEIVARADAALYEAKAAGRDCVRAAGVMRAPASESGVTPDERRELFR
jgi:predicted signal transduction protein with EAL and GGDEF domain